MSLNASTEDLYQELARPNLACENVLDEVKDFIKKSVEAGIQTTASVVDGYKDYDIDVKACENIALEAAQPLESENGLKADIKKSRNG